MALNERFHEADAQRHLHVAQNIKKTAVFFPLKDEERSDCYNSQKDKE